MKKVSCLKSVSIGCTFLVEGVLVAGAGGWWLVAVAGENIW